MGTSSRSTGLLPTGAVHRVRRRSRDDGPRSLTGRSRRGRSCPGGRLRWFRFAAADSANHWLLHWRARPCIPLHLANNPMKKLRLVLWLVVLCPCLARADAFDDLARDFWAWRTNEQPISTDDIPRIERPANWVPKWSPADVKEYRRQLGEFESRWRKIDATSW